LAFLAHDEVNLKNQRPEFWSKGFSSGAFYGLSDTFGEFMWLTFQRPTWGS
jgi:hypothetical protein